MDPAEIGRISCVAFTFAPINLTPKNPTRRYAMEHEHLPSRQVAELRPLPANAAVRTALFRSTSMVKLLLPCNLSTAVGQVPDKSTIIKEISMAEEEGFEPPNELPR